jgi:hypothetical protein
VTRMITSVLVAAALMSAPARALDLKSAPSLTSLRVTERSPSPFVRVSPLGTSMIELTPTAQEGGVFVFALAISTSDGTRTTIPRVRACDVLATDVGRIVTVEAPDTHALPATIRILDLRGNELASRPGSGIRGPSRPATSWD